MRIVVRCREEVERGFVIREPYALISVRDPDKQPVRIRKSGLCKAVLSLAFHDAEPSSGLTLPSEIRLMSTNDAAAIWQFVWEHRATVNAIVIHCEQGMSRSPAIAAGIAFGLGEDPSRFAARYQPNEYVLKLVREAAGDGPRRPDSPTKQ